uniref:Uncharacterized protein n=1 Tax=Anopheles culicifacies TaxID=139723 RepID=A0A182LS62_9DIPT
MKEVGNMLTSFMHWTAVTLLAEILAASDLILWIAFGSFMGVIAVEEDITTTSFPEAQNFTTTTSPTTPTTTTTTFSSSSTLSSSSEATTSSSLPTTPILARANPLSTNSILRSIISTTTTGTTTKPSAKRQISLTEFQQLVAKVNDEISMLRKQSANLSQTYEELVRRYNERTLQTPVVQIECSNSTTKQDTSLTESTTVPSTEIRTTITTSTSKAPSSTKAVEYTTEKLTHSAAYSKRTPPHDAELSEPQDSGSYHTQIYGNKYYNYIHYFMYPPSETQLANFGNPAQTNYRRKNANAPGKQRKEDPKEKRNKWNEPNDSWEETEESELDTAQSFDFRRRPELSTSSKYPYGGQYRFGSSVQRKPPIVQSSPVPSWKIPQYLYDEEWNSPPQVESKKRTPPEAVRKTPAYIDQLATFLERRNINRNDPIQRTTLAPARQVSSFPAFTSETVKSPTIENLFAFGAKPVNYTVPTTGNSPTGYDGYDFSFMRKALENKKRLQREQRSARRDLRGL